MSYDSLLIDTCIVRRYAEGAQDAYGIPVKTWANYLIDEPCRLRITGGREIKVGAEVVLSNHRLYLNDIDITERDRVVIGTVTYEVLLVSDRQDATGNHHKEVDLIEVS